MMTQRELKVRMVNTSRTPSRCWCPVCQEGEKKVERLGVWVNPAGLFVCAYGICDPCASTVGANAPHLQTKMVDLVEQRLLARYPELWNKLNAK